MEQLASPPRQGRPGRLAVDLPAPSTLHRCAKLPLTRSQRAQTPFLTFVFEPTDNAAMIAYVGLLRLQRGLIDPLTVMQRSKWPIDECEADFADDTEATEKKPLASAP